MRRFGTVGALTMILSVFTAAPANGTDTRVDLPCPGAKNCVNVIAVGRANASYTNDTFVYGRDDTGLTTLTAEFDKWITGEVNYGGMFFNRFNTHVDGSADVQMGHLAARASAWSEMTGPYSESFTQTHGFAGYKVRWKDSIVLQADGEYQLTLKVAGAMSQDATTSTPAATCSATFCAYGYSGVAAFKGWEEPGVRPSGLLASIEKLWTGPGTPVYVGSKTFTGKALDKFTIGAVLRVYAQSLVEWNDGFGHTLATSQFLGSSWVHLEPVTPGAGYVSTSQTSYLPARDADGDGVLDPDDPDDDNDGVPDDTDVCRQLADPEQLNFDGDYWGDACDPDDDADDLADAAEAELGSDPLDPDSDDDTLGDGIEVRTYRSDPLDRDTDGDLYGDRTEAGVSMLDDWTSIPPLAGVFTGLGAGENPVTDPLEPLW